MTGFSLSSSKAEGLSPAGTRHTGRAMAAKNSPSASPAPLPAVTSVRASMEESVLAGSAARRARGMLLAACMRARTTPGPLPNACGGRLPSGQFSTTKHCACRARPFAREPRPPRAR